MSSRTRLTFAVALDDSGRTVDLHISDPSRIAADNLALATWGSSQVLANTLHRLHVDNAKTILELGAGTGIVGMTAAAVWHSKNVILTDLEPILPNIAASIKLNEQTLAEHGGAVEFGLLDWYDPSTLILGASQNKVSLLDVGVILAADTVYSEEHPQLLVNVVSQRLQKSSAARFVMCYPLRIGYLDHIRDLWQRLEEAGLECCEEGREQLDKSWDDDTPYEWCVWQWQHLKVEL
ncbi:hypothetical protein K470DRAFT_264772 [Piedraia hortae CBS 480.64]|uniref:Uncharacterized protein n=1 Tax=Piedraia hortae CBS 480.64 TaxID=1314780 RepID=A0A6A7BZI1_9PEZI|nr:hypothetical protein K470DRAFT_264772 [Piedraia hortae CBS 480.64]